MSLFRSGDYAKKKETVRKTRLSTQAKSKPVYCRNCNKQNVESAKICVQCEFEIKSPKLRKKMK